MAFASTQWLPAHDVPQSARVFGGGVRSSEVVGTAGSVGSEINRVDRGNSVRVTNEVVDDGGDGGCLSPMRGGASPEVKMLESLCGEVVQDVTQAPPAGSVVWWHCRLLNLPTPTRSTS